jgi:DNA-binding IclR family transcriptional regulator
VSGLGTGDDGAEGLSVRILQALAQSVPQGMSLPRLCKQVGVGASAAMRCLSAMGAQPVGVLPGPGWTELTSDGGRWHVSLTMAGQRAMAEMAPLSAVKPVNEANGHCAERPFDAGQP